MFNPTTTPILFMALLTIGCVQTPVDKTKITTATIPIPNQDDRGSFKQIIKTEFDRLADLEVRQNTESIKTLMLKLYKRNPKELKKGPFASPEEAIRYVFENHTEHHFLFDSINHLQSTDAIFLAFNPNYSGDRVFAFIAGLQTMLLKAHGSINDFYLLNELNPQYLYNFARNVEIAAWKLANTKDEDGNIYLLSNELNELEKNITFEREFGKIIGRTDLFAIALSEKSERTITRVIQNIATALFLPI